MSGIFSLWLVIMVECPIIVLYQPEELVGSKIGKYFVNQRQFKNAAVEEVFLRDDGTLGAVSGKFVTHSLRCMNMTHRESEFTRLLMRLANNFQSPYG